MKYKIFLIIIILILSRITYASPVAGVSGISGNTERASALARILEKHILEILNKNSFNTIDPSIISRELIKFNCTEEKCVLNFAENADIDLIVTGSVTDKTKSIIIKLESYGINIPFNKRIINKYEIKIPMDVSIGTREFSLISEEHAAEFLTRTLDIFLYRVAVKPAGEKFILKDDLKISGKFILYSRDSNGSIKETGKADISDGSVSVISGNIFSNESFILLPFKDQSKAVKNYYTARKRQIVFEKTSFYDTLFMLAVIPAASASMPFSSPFLGYYMNNDWSGLGLWMLNAPPYLYIEARGLINSPKRLKEENENISRDDRAMNYFAWYMLLAGGMPLFIDSYTNNYLHQASYFTGNSDLMGNTATAVMLSLTGNGTGHFYRGSRYWGYFYFHLNNILLYMTLREFSAPEHYNEASDTYKKGSTNREKGIALCSIFALSKTIEIIHAAMGKENISSGEIIDEYIIPSPLFTLDEKGDPVFGVNITLKF
jgi:hypothetical protein